MDFSRITGRLIDAETRDKAARIFAAFNTDYKFKFGGVLRISDFIRQMVNELFDYMHKDGRLSI